MHGGGDHPVPGQDGDGDPRQLRRRGRRKRLRLDPPVRERARAQATLRPRLPERLLEERDLPEGPDHDRPGADQGHAPGGDAPLGHPVGGAMAFSADTLRDRVNLTGVFLFSQAVGRVMIRQRAGKIVNVTSVAGRTGSRGMAAYAAAKAGATVLTQSLGAEWAKHGITVNAVAPGPVETEGVLEVWKTPAMAAQAAREVPLQRLGRPEEIAWAVIFVASDQANFMTGETVYVSGGPRVSNREEDRSEERRVGKECRSRWSPDH